MEFKDIAPFLGILLPAIGAIFMYRAAERQRVREVDKAVQAAPLGVVAALSDKESSLSMGIAIAELADAIRKGVAIMREGREDPTAKRQIDRALDEMTAIRREITDIAHLMRHSQARDERQG